MKFQIKTILVFTFSLMLLSACTHSVDEDTSSVLDDGFTMPSYMESNDDILETDVVEVEEFDDRPSVNIPKDDVIEDDFLITSDDEDVEAIESESETEEPIEVPEVEVLEEKQPDENA